MPLGIWILKVSTAKCPEWQEHLVLEGRRQFLSSTNQSHVKNVISWHTPSALRAAV